MATEPKISVTSANLAANAVLNTLSSGWLYVFSGSVPTTGSSSGGGVLSFSSFASTASSTAAAGVGTWNAIGATTALGTGTASFFRVYDFGAAGSTAATSGGVFQGLVAAAAADLNFNSVAFSSGAAVTITSFTYTQKTS